MQMLQQEIRGKKHGIRTDCVYVLKLDNILLDLHHSIVAENRTRTVDISISDLFFFWSKFQTWMHVFFWHETWMHFLFESAFTNECKSKRIVPDEWDSGLGG